MHDQVNLNEDFFRNILKSEAVDALCRASAERVLAEARAKAPVDTGDYRDHLHIEVVHHAYRDTYEVGSDSGHTLAVEARHGTLGRALRSARR